MSHLAEQFVNLTLAPDTLIDLHMHTLYSDGRWTAEQVIGYLTTEGFNLAAITDHDRIDQVSKTQALASEKHLPILSGVEMSTQWKGQQNHVLCYGFKSEHNELGALIERIENLQLENTYAVNAELRSRGYAIPNLHEIVVKADSPIRPAINAHLLYKYKCAPNWAMAKSLMTNAGFRPIVADIKETVEAAHRSEAICLIAHPGRHKEGFTLFSPVLLDQLCAEVPIDGLEVYHPDHNRESVALYLEYARKHNLLVSAGSDSHGFPDRIPIKYRASTCRNLLERLGVTILY